MEVFGIGVLKFLRLDSEPKMTFLQEREQIVRKRDVSCGTEAVAGFDL